MKSSAQLQREAEAQRAELSSTLDRLGDSLSVNAMSTELMGLVRESGVSLVKSLAEQARANPVPALLIGVGLTMMLTKGSGIGHGAGDLVGKAGHMLKDAVSGGVAAARHSAEDMTHAASTAGKRMRDLASDARHRVEEAEHAVEGRAQGLKQRIAEKAEAGMEQAKAALHDGQDRARHLREDAERLALQGKDSLQQFAHEQPILMAAAGAALGAALGALFPMTEAERRYMGEASARATRVGRETAARVADVVKSEALGDHPETKVAAVAEKVVRTITKEIGNPTA